MRDRRPALALLLTLAGMSVSGAAQEAPRCIALRVDVPTGQSPEIRTEEGPRSAQVQLQDGQDTRSFYLGLVVLNESGRVLITIRNDDGAVLDRFEMAVGDAARRTATSPSFGLSLLEIYERAGRSCRP